MKAFQKVAILAITLVFGFGLQSCAKKKDVSSAADAAASGTGSGTESSMGSGV
jgi:tryptophan synthase alpha subunit